MKMNAMNVKLILASLGGAILSFLLGWLVYGILLKGFYEANTTHYEGLIKELPNIPLIFLSCLVMSFLLAYVFQRWAGFKSFGKGFTGGMIIGFLICLSYDLSFMSMYNLFAFSVVVVDVIVGTIFNGIVGGVIALILGFEKKTAAA
jgi:hypothetical protein